MKKIITAIVAVVILIGIVIGIIYTQNSNTTLESNLKLLKVNEVTRSVF